MGMPTQHKATINVEAVSTAEANQKAVLLEIIGEHIDFDNLTILAKAAKKPGVNKKIQQFKSFL